MERRELYDPEDIEQLLLERPFDELLDEERAFVLRHLTGRDEYERMRNLLLTVHYTEREEEVLEAEPLVRDRVMETFRTQRQPQWRIWLNSVRAFALPKEPRSYWKPALAFASIAILVTVGVNVFRSQNEQANVMAELKGPVEHTGEQAAKVADEKPKPEQPTATMETVNNGLTSDSQLGATASREELGKYKWTATDGTALELKEADDKAAGVVDAEKNTGLVAPAPSVMAPSANYSINYEREADRLDVAEEQRDLTFGAFGKKNEDALERVENGNVTDQEEAGHGFIANMRTDSGAASDTIRMLMDVTAKDLATNISLSNEAPTSVMKVETARRKAKMDRHRTRSLGEVGKGREQNAPAYGEADEEAAISADLMGLLKAAW
jgi:hypothetical protein